MAGANRIITPDKVRELQIVLYRKAKAQPKHRFWSLYGELLRQDVLDAALEVQVRNEGAPGVDGETTQLINASPEKRQHPRSKKTPLTIASNRTKHIQTRPCSKGRPVANSLRW
jgi:hypothetical protein